MAQASLSCPFGAIHLQVARRPGVSRVGSGTAKSDTQQEAYTGAKLVDYCPHSTSVSLRSTASPREKLWGAAAPDHQITPSLRGPKGAVAISS